MMLNAGHSGGEVQYRVALPTNQGPAPGGHMHMAPPGGTTYTTTVHEEERYETLDDDYDDADGMIEPDMEDTGHMQYVDGRCSCCPYGYHIDLDFLHFQAAQGKGHYLKNLKAIRHNKRKLRKSMEVFLSQQDGQSAPPPDSMHSNENFMHLVEYEDNATSRMLEEIDTSVNQTLSSIDTLMYNKNNRGNMIKGSDSFDSYDDEYDGYGPGQPYVVRETVTEHHEEHFLTDNQNDQRYRSEAELELERQKQEERYRTEAQLAIERRKREERYRTEAELALHQPVIPKAESVSSLSSQSTFSSEQQSSMQSSASKDQRYSTHMYITSQQLAGQMANLLPQDQPSSTDAGSSDVANISPDTLKAIREQMSISLQRMRDLEEQVKAIPVLQVRISVLKEEKRLLMLQAKAKNNKLNTRTVGSGDCRIDDWDRRKPSRTVGVGDHNIFDDYQIATMNGSLDNCVRERELHTEQSTHVLEKEKEIHTLLLGGSQDIPDYNRRKIVEKPKVPTRSIGVGESNVFDASSNMHVHEKETRTLIIGGKGKDAKKTRNVGVLCRSQMRDVGVMYMCEDARPETRTVAVGVNEGGMYFEGPGEHAVIHKTVNMSQTSLNQMNMASFHTRNININKEHLALILDEKLKKDLHSVGIQTLQATREHKSTDTGSMPAKDSRTIGCGEDTIDVVIRPVINTRTVGIDNRPALMHRSTTTEKMHMKDASTTYRAEGNLSKGVNTDKVKTYPATTNTDSVRMTEAGTDTDLKIFQALDQIKNVGSNTPVVNKSNTGVNTDVEEVIETETADKSISTANLIQIHNRGVNTELIRQVSTGIGDRNINTPLDCDVCLSKPKMRNISIGTLPPQTRNVSVGENYRTEVYTKESVVEAQRQAQAQAQKDIEVIKSELAQETNRKLDRMHTELETKRKKTIELEEKSRKLQQEIEGKRKLEFEMKMETRRKTEMLESESRKKSDLFEIEERKRQELELEWKRRLEKEVELRRKLEFELEAIHKRGHTGDFDLRRRIGILEEEARRKDEMLEMEERKKVEFESEWKRRLDIEIELRRKLEFELEQLRKLEQTEKKTVTTSVSAGRARHALSTTTAQDMLQSTSTQEVQSSMETSDMRDSGITFEQGPGGTQMRVIRTMETSYVGGQPVNRSSKVEFRDRDGSHLAGGGASTSSSSTTEQTTKTERNFGLSSSRTVDTGEQFSTKSYSSSRFGSRFQDAPSLQLEGAQSETHKEQQTSEDGRSHMEKTVTQSTVPSRLGRTMTVTETRIERRSGGSGAFSESSGRFNGGGLKSIMKTGDSNGEGSAKKKEITFAEGVVGGFELEPAIKESCEIYAQWLTDSTKVTTKQLNASLNSIQQEWFKVSSHKLSNAAQVEDYLSSFKEISSDLLSHNVNMADANGNTALHYAVSHCNMEIVTMLLDTSVVDVDKLNKAGYTAIMLASLAQVQSPDQHDVIRRLFTMGDINARAAQAGQTALMLAVSHGRLDMVKGLLEAGASINMQDDDGSTALMCACEHGHTDIVKVLLAHPDCDPMVTDNDGSTAMSIAMEAGHRDVGVLLYAHVNFKQGSPVTKISAKMKRGSRDYLYNY